MKIALIIGIIVVIAIVAFVLLKKNKQEISTTPKETPPSEPKETKQPTPEIKIKEESKPEIKLDFNNLKPKSESKKEIKLPEIFTPLTKSNSEIMNEVEKNIKTAIEEYQIQREMIIEMLKEFEEQLKSNKNEIDNLINKKEWEELEHIIHSLKGSSLNLKLDILGKPIQYIDDLLKQQKDVDNIKTYIDFVYKSSEKIFSKLK